MANPDEILRSMIDNVEGQSDNLASSISQVDEQIDDLDEQIDGVQNGLCAVAESTLESYLDGTKVTQLELLLPGEAQPFSVDYGGTFGTIGWGTGNITDWMIVDATGVEVFSYLGTNWDGDTTIIKLITDYAFGNDYLTRPLTDGATYGLYPAKANLEIAKSILEENKDKIDQSETTFEDYAS